MKRDLGRLLPKKPLDGTARSIAAAGNLLSNFGRFVGGVSRAVWLAVLVLATSANPAIAMVRIENDYGGRIGSYIEKFKRIRDLEERVEIDGDCISACTLLLRYIPRDRVCVTPRARLGFHAAWKPGFLGVHVFNTAGTQILLRSYPADVRAWLLKQGGLSDQMMYLSGASLQAVYRPCED